MNTREKTYRIVLAAMMTCLIMVAILFIRLPIPFTQGYVHPGDAMIFLAVLILGWKYGALAAALGGMLGDLIGGFAMWAPWTFVIKGVMALILGACIAAFSGKDNGSGKWFLTGEVLGMTLAGIFMTAAYYAAEGIMYGNWLVPLAGIPWNIGQFAVGMVIAEILAGILRKTPARKYFVYTRPFQTAEKMIK